MFLCVRMVRMSVCYLSALAVCCLLNLTACSDDNGDGDDPSGLFEGSWEEAPYQADAVKYKVAGHNEIGSIELTSSGNFLILPSETVPALDVAFMVTGKVAKTISFLGKAVKPNTRAGGIPRFGTFTKNGDGSYRLGEYATLYKVGEEQLKLETTDGSSSILSVKKEEVKAESSKLNKRLCRSWHPVSVTLTAYQNGKQVGTQTLTKPEDLESEFYNYIVISPFGTFIQVDYGDIIEDTGVWSWMNMEQQKFQYSLPDGNGIIQVSFTDDMAWFNDEYSDVDDNGDPITIKVVAKCKAS